MQQVSKKDETKRCIVCDASDAKACARCRVVHYCGAGHQKEDHKLHRALCSARGKSTADFLTQRAKWLYNSAKWPTNFDPADTQFHCDVCYATGGNGGHRLAERDGTDTAICDVCWFNYSSRPAAERHISSCNVAAAYLMDIGIAENAEAVEHWDASRSFQENGLAYRAAFRSRGTQWFARVDSAKGQVLGFSNKLPTAATDAADGGGGGDLKQERNCVLCKHFLRCESRLLYVRKCPCGCFFYCSAECAAATPHKCPEASMATQPRADFSVPKPANYDAASPTVIDDLFDLVTRTLAGEA